MEFLISDLQDHFHGIFEQDLLVEMHKCGKLVELEEDAFLMQPGSHIKFIPIVLKGSLKILRQESDGRELLLYFINSKDSCAISLTCCLQSKISEIIAQVEEKCKLILIPIEKVDEWICKYQSWKIFVFMTYQKRFDDMMQTIDSMAFAKLDERLITLIKRKMQLTNSEKILYTTHEELANELATSREVVSRLLKQLEKLNRVKLSRNKIELI